jgi:hypothetical protein
LVKRPQISGQPGGIASPHTHRDGDLWIWVGVIDALCPCWPPRRTVFYPNPRGAHGVSFPEQRLTASCTARTDLIPPAAPAARVPVVVPRDLTAQELLYRMLGDAPRQKTRPQSARRVLPAGASCCPAPDATYPAEPGVSVPAGTITGKRVPPEKASKGDGIGRWVIQRMASHQQCRHGRLHRRPQRLVNPWLSVGAFLSERGPQSLGFQGVVWVFLDPVKAVVPQGEAV